MSNTRDIRKLIRFSEDEFEKINEGLNDSYADTFSAYVRNAALKAAKESIERKQRLDDTNA